VGTSIQDARAADGKRKGQKKENRIFDIKPESKMTFQELSDWYLSLEKVKALKSYPALETTWVGSIPSLENGCKCHQAVDLETTR